MTIHRMNRARIRGLRTPGATSCLHADVVGPPGTRITPGYPEDPRSKTLKDQVDVVDKKLGDLLSGPKKSPGFGPINRDLTRLVTGVESADVAPTETAISAVQENCKVLAMDLEKWRTINSDLTGLNSAFAKSRLAPLTVAQSLFKRLRRLRLVLFVRISYLVMSGNSTHYGLQQLGKLSLATLPGRYERSNQSCRALV